MIGLVSWLVLLPAGPVAWHLGARESKAIEAGAVAGSDQPLIRLAVFLGIVGSVLWAVMAVAAFVVLGGERMS